MAKTKIKGQTKINGAKKKDKMGIKHKPVTIYMYISVCLCVCVCVCMCVCVCVCVCIHTYTYIRILILRQKRSLLFPYLPWRMHVYSYPYKRYIYMRRRIHVIWGGGYMYIHTRTCAIYAQHYFNVGQTYRVSFFLFAKKANLLFIKKKDKPIICLCGSGSLTLKVLGGGYMCHMRRRIHVHSYV